MFSNYSLWKCFIDVLVDVEESSSCGREFDPLSSHSHFFLSQQIFLFIYPHSIQDLPQKKKTYQKKQKKKKIKKFEKPDNSTISNVTDDNTENTREWALPSIEITASQW